MNYILFPEKKIAIEISRHVNEIPDYIKETVNRLQDKGFEDEISSISVKDMTLEEMARLYEGYSLASNLSFIETDMLLLLWLDFNGIDCEIVSEHELKPDELKEYTILNVGQI